MDDPKSQGSEEIFRWIEENLKRDEIPQKGSANRASSAPGCPRKRWYQNNSYRAEPLSGRSTLVFAMGDVAEHVVKYFISRGCVGPGKLYSEVDFGDKSGTFTIQHREFDIYKQRTVYTEVSPGLVIPGHVDGWGKRNSDGRWEVLDVKSSANFGFEKFVKGSTDYGPQMHVLMMSDEGQKKKCQDYRLFYLRKETSHLFDRGYSFDPNVWQSTIDGFVQSNHDQIPDRPYRPCAEMRRKEPTGRWYLEYPCSYCDYRPTCYPQFEVEFSPQGKPRFIFDKNKETKSDAATKTS